jgi:transmembrane sensor
VLSGRVAVRWPGGEAELGAGEAGWYPASDQVVRPEVPSETARALPTVRAAQPERTRPSSWRQHAEQGEFQEAFALLERERTRVSDDVEELLLAADAARLSNHAAQAVPYLQRVVRRHASDPRAPLAAFTLGGVLMNQLGRPREAGEAYARARALSPSSALSQDALARQVEAAHRASDAAAARVLALEYLERYPDGRRVSAVRRFGGLP